jgi:hypothetical protein
MKCIGSTVDSRESGKSHIVSYSTLKMEATDYSVCHAAVSPETTVSFSCAVINMSFLQLLC